MNIAVFGWTLDRPLLEAVTAARALRRAGDTLLLCAAGFSSQALEQAARLDVDGIVRVMAPCAQPDLTAAACELTARLALQTVLFPAGRRGRTVAAALAERLNGDCALCCTALERGPDGALRVTQPVFASNAAAVFTVCAPLCFLVLRDRSFTPALPTQTHAPVHALACADVPAALLPDAVEPFEEDALDRSELVVVGGRGIEDRRDLALVQDFARALGGAFGATRPLVMSGLVPASLQIGQSGRTIAPKLCITVGVSGATPFLAGIGPSTRLLAVNRDPDARIFSCADYGMIADYRTLLPALTEMWRV